MVSPVLLGLLAMLGPRHVPVGFVWKVSGRVELRAAGGKPKRLDARKDRFKLLYADSQLHVVSGSIEYRFGVQTPKLGRNRGWKTLGMYGPVRSTADQARLTQAFRAMERVAGAERKDDSIGLVMPMRDSKMRAGHAVLTWNVPSNISSVTLTVTRGGAALWGPLRVPAFPPEYRSDGLRRSLEARAGDAPDGCDVELNVAGRTSSTHFELMTSEDDARTAADLRALGASGGILRIQLLASMNLAAEACDEAWKLWTGEPSSEALTVYAYNVCSQLGDFVHARRIKPHLPSQP